MHVNMVLIITILLLAGIEFAEECRDFTKHPNWRLIDQGTPCGRSASMSFRIMGGQNANPGEFPWITTLFFRGDFLEPAAECGGSIINNRYILTAGHCCENTRDNQLTFVRVSEVDESLSKDCDHKKCAPRYHDYLIENIIPHPAFNIFAALNDMCLLRLQEPIKFNEFVTPVCLPYPCNIQEMNMTGQDLTVAGWGVTDSDTYQEPDILQKVNLTVVDQKACNKEWADLQSVGDTQICAGVKVGQDACPGDSGGPLIYKVKEDGLSRAFIIGLVSYGEDCSRMKKSLRPGVYTRVFSFMDWILDTIKD